MVERFVLLCVYAKFKLGQSIAGLMAVPHVLLHLNATQSWDSSRMRTSIGKFDEKIREQISFPMHFLQCDLRTLSQDLQKMGKIQKASPWRSKNAPF